MHYGMRNKTEKSIESRLNEECTCTYNIIFLYSILDRTVTSHEVKQSVDLIFKMFRTIMAN